MLKKILKVKNRTYRYYSIAEYAQNNGFNINQLPLCIKVLYENLLRHSDREYIKPEQLKEIANWKPYEKSNRAAIAFHPARVLMQDFTGGPAIADLAAMRDALYGAGGDGALINPLIPVDMVIDHSVMIDYFGTEESFHKNVRIEFDRNAERYRFFKWGSRLSIILG